MSIVQGVANIHVDMHACACAPKGGSPPACVGKSYPKKHVKETEIAHEAHQS